jgi:chemotaxis methyl-accepting protein methylase
MRQRSIASWTRSARVAVGGSVDSQYLIGAASGRGHSISNHSLGDEADAVPIQLFGTDVSETSIAKARAGVYPENIELDVQAARLRRFFVKLDGQYQVRKAVRELCVFAKHNLATDPP